MVIGLTAFSLTAKAFRHGLERLADVHITIDVYVILFNVLVPLAVLIINVMVVREVRRASKTAVTTLGRQRSTPREQQQQQSTSSNSAVPTVMMLTTSLIYVLLCGTYSCLYVVTRWLPYTSLDHDSRLILWQVHHVAFAWRNLIYAYNFFVYLITGKQFRSELCRLFRFCHSAVAAAVEAIDNIRLSLRVQSLTRTQ